jgi:hypothetical protein
MHLLLFMAVSLRVGHYIDKQLRQRIDVLVKGPELDGPGEVGVPACLMVHAKPLPAALLGTGDAVDWIFVSAAETTLTTCENSEVSIAFAAYEPFNTPTHALPSGCGSRSHILI